MFYEYLCKKQPEHSDWNPGLTQANSKIYVVNIDGIVS